MVSVGKPSVSSSRSRCHCRSQPHGDVSPSLVSLHACPPSGRQELDFFTPPCRPFFRLSVAAYHWSHRSLFSPILALFKPRVGPNFLCYWPLHFSGSARGSAEHGHSSLQSGFVEGVVNTPFNKGTSALGWRIRNHTGYRYNEDARYSFKKSSFILLCK